MIYAIIIIVSLALAFIIVIRRLPSAIEVSRRTGPNSVPQTATGSPRPTSGATLVTSSPNRQIMDRLKILTSRLRSIRMPKLPNRLKSPPENPKPLAAEPVKPVSDDFWSSTSTLKPIKEPESAVTVPTEKGRGKNFSQEADDLFAVGDFRKAERLYLRLATEDPKNPKVYSRLGIIYLEQKNYEDARDALQQAIKFEPTVASRHFNLALAYINLGSKAKAIVAMEMALKHDPSNRKYRKMLDEILVGRV